MFDFRSHFLFSLFKEIASFFDSFLFPLADLFSNVGSVFDVGVVPRLISFLINLSHFLLILKDPIENLTFSLSLYSLKVLLLFDLERSCSLHSFVFFFFSELSFSFFLSPFSLSRFLSLLGSQSVLFSLMSLLILLKFEKSHLFLLLKALVSSFFTLNSSLTFFFLLQVCLHLRISNFFLFESFFLLQLFLLMKDFDLVLNSLLQLPLLLQIFEIFILQFFNV